MMEWRWNAPDEGRAERAKDVRFSKLDLNADSPSALVSGSGKEDYIVTLDSCTCKDFVASYRKGGTIPCKHILALAMKAGIVNESGKTPAQQRAADIESLRSRIAAAYGFYHLFSDPIMSDPEYDRAKEKLADLQKEENT